MVPRFTGEPLVPPCCPLLFRARGGSVYALRRVGVPAVRVQAQIHSERSWRPVVSCGHPRPHQCASVEAAFGRLSLRLSGLEARSDQGPEARAGEPPSRRRTSGPGCAAPRAAQGRHNADTGLGSARPLARRRDRARAGAPTHNRHPSRRRGQPGEPSRTLLLTLMKERQLLEIDWLSAGAAAAGPAAQNGLEEQHRLRQRQTGRRTFGSSRSSVRKACAQVTSAQWWWKPR